MGQDIASFAESEIPSYTEDDNNDESYPIIIMNNLSCLNLESFLLE